MSQVEKIAARYHALARKLAYDGFAGLVDPDEQAELDRLAEELRRLNALKLEPKLEAA